MDRIALYYPYIHVRDDTWLKYAALYWPQMGRLRPPNYPTNDSPVARTLQNELKWLIDLPSDVASLAVEEPFVELLHEHAPALRQRFGLGRLDDWNTELKFSLSNVMQASAAPERGAMLDPRLGYIHVSKVNQELMESLVDYDLAVLQQGRGGMWLGMHPELAGVYMCALTEQVATKNRLYPITDQTLPHSALSGWTMAHLAEVLLAQRFTGSQQPQPGNPLDVFVLMAFDTVVPANLASVPIDKIVEVRSKFGRELDSFRAYVATQVERLAEVEDVSEFVVFQEYIRNDVQRSVGHQLKELRERLRSVGLESVRALANIKSLALPPVAAAAAQAVGLSPTVTGPTVAAACIASVAGRIRKARRDVIRDSPVGYLFRVERELDPASLAERVRRSLQAR